MDMTTTNIRQMREALEEQSLGPNAVLSANSRGRRFEEKPCPVRTCFQRDRDRIIHSKAFRRLMHKTQVFIAPEGDHYRTRLTHTIEVSQVARTIARALKLNEDLAEAISLGHDLGHAPFGHAGENALNRLMKEYAGESFHHSLQSLRVVDYLERKRGLNLTYEVRNGILAHTKGKASLSSSGVFAEPETLEAEVVRICDRLAYINHDIDDAVRAGIIKNTDIPEDVREIIGGDISSRFHAMITDVVQSSMGREHITLSPQIKSVIERLKEFMFRRVYTNSPAKSEEHKAYILISHLFNHLMQYPEKIPCEIVEWGIMTEARVKKKKLPSLEDDGPRARAVCDYIAGMTDRYAVSIYKHLFIPGGWNIGFDSGSDKDR